MLISNILIISTKILFLAGTAIIYLLSEKYIIQKLKTFNKGTRIFLLPALISLVSVSIYASIKSLDVLLGVFPIILLALITGTLIKSFNQSKKILIALVLLSVFIIALYVRLHIIFFTPEKNNYIDLCIYIDSGQLMSRGINPYNHSDSVEIRNRLRTDITAYNKWTCQNQEMWDSYASGNLPLSLFLFGLIEKASFSSAGGYRIAFALFDSLLAVLIGMFVLAFWKSEITTSKYMIILGLCALSPILIKWGTIIPEDKGIQILLMVAALYFARSKNYFQRIYVSALFLGLSIAFKGIGIFLLPLCLYWALLKPKNIQEISKKGNMQNGMIYLFLSIFFVFIWFVPYMPHVFTMMFIRLIQGLGIETSMSMPMFHFSKMFHASIWRYFYAFFPRQWSLLKNITILLSLFITIYGFIRRKLSMEILTANLLLIFTVISLTTGSVDRMNMAILISILLVGMSSPNKGFTLSKYYFFGGLLMLGMGEDVEGVMILFYIIIYAKIIAVMLLNKTNGQESNLLENNRLSTGKL